MCSVSHSCFVDLKGHLTGKTGGQRPTRGGPDPCPWPAASFLVPKASCAEARSTSDAGRESRWQLLLEEASAFQDYQLSNLTLLSPDPHPWTSFELNVISGKLLRGRGRRPCWPGSEVGLPRRSSQKRRQMTGGGVTTPSSTPSWPGVPAGRTPLLLLTPEG